MKTKMKKTAIAAACLLAVTTGSAFAHGGETQTVAKETAAVGSSAPAPKIEVKSAGLSIKVNGVEVQSFANHIKDGKAYASVQAFAELLGTKAIVSENRQSVQIGSKTITDLDVEKGELTAWVKDLADAVGAQSVTWNSENQEAYVLALPAGSIKISEVVPTMGEHWANPAAGELPIGPIYGVYNGKLVFLEYMIAQEDFVKGNNHVNLNGMKGLPSPAVVQSDIEFQPSGHPGFEAPHFDLHFYFISDEEQQAIK